MKTLSAPSHTIGSSRRNTLLGMLLALLGPIIGLRAKSPEPKRIQHQWRQVGDEELLQQGDVWASKNPNDTESNSGDGWSPGLTIQLVHPKAWGKPMIPGYWRGTCWRPTGSKPVFE